MIVHILLAILVLMFIHDMCMREQRMQLMIQFQWQQMQHMQRTIAALRRRRSKKPTYVPEQPPQVYKEPMVVDPMVPEPVHDTSPQYEYILHPFTTDPSMYAEDPVNQFFTTGALSEMTHPEHTRLRNHVDFLEDSALNEGHRYTECASPRMGIPQTLAASPRRPLQHIDSDSDSEDIDDTYMKSLRT